MTQWRIVYRPNTRAATWCAERGLSPGERTKIIALERDEATAAVALYDNYRGSSIELHTEREPGAWVPAGYFYAVYAYAFLQLEVERITAPIPESRARAIRLAEHVGFVLETRLSRAVRADGVTQDLLMYVMWREECRVLTRRFRTDWLRLEKSHAA